ncbi:MATE family efflux transporter [Marimonas arenosa]|uniref:Multidrug-efflux transporter n=1 Tax=Marimonas arenosa TaxID=1795305 RepID=A0AAE3WCQ3_9RHOB|nr:MATE family efflux transporter [Marimonas arenosa]MDQ2089260.1 MATE family efflux transporter [Marimonas arenosa]
MRDPLTYGGHLRAVLGLGLPLIGGNLAQFAITLTDAVMLGWYDVEALAGEVLGGMVIFVLFLFGSGLALAVMPLVAEAEAAEDATRVRRVTRMGLWASVGFAVACFPVFVFARPLLLLLGQAPGVAELAAQYMQIAGFAIVFSLLGMVLKSYLSALERTAIVLWGTVAAAVINAVANYVLIFGNWGAPELGIRGAAMASFVAQMVMFLALLVYVLVRANQHALFVRLWRPDWAALALVARLGLPIGLTILAETSLFAASSVMMGWLGAAALAAHGIALQLSSATFMIHLGLSSAATVRAGRAVGRRDGTDLRRGARVVTAVSMAVALLAVVVFLAVPGWLVGLFLDPSDPQRGEVLAVGVVLMAAAALFQLVDAAQVIALGLLRGVQDTKVPMLMAVVAYWVIGVPVSYGLGFPAGLGGVGVWLGLAIGLAVAAGLLMWRFWARAMQAAVPAP